MIGNGFRVATKWPDEEGDECPQCAMHLKPAIPMRGPPDAIAVVCVSCGFNAIRETCKACGDRFTREEQSEYRYPDFFHARCVQ